MARLCLIIVSLLLSCATGLGSDNCTDALQNDTTTYLSKDPQNEYTKKAQELYPSVKTFAENRPIKEVRRLAEFFSKYIGFGSSGPTSVLVRDTSRYVKNYYPLPSEDDSPLHIQITSLSDSKVRLAAPYLFACAVRDVEIKPVRQKLIDLFNCPVHQNPGSSDKKSTDTAK